MRSLLVIALAAALCAARAAELGPSSACYGIVQEVVNDPSAVAVGKGADFCLKGRHARGKRRD